MDDAMERRTGGAAEAVAEKAKKMAGAPETKEKFERMLRELARSFADIWGRNPSGEEKKALRSLAQVSAAFAAMADDARGNGQK